MAHFRIPRTDLWPIIQYLRTKTGQFTKEWLDLGEALRRILTSLNLLEGNVEGLLNAVEAIEDDGVAERPWEAVFGVGNASELAPGSDVFEHIDAVGKAGVPFFIVGNNKNWPDPGTDILVDIQRRPIAEDGTPGGWTSVLPSGNSNKFKIPKTDTGPQIYTGLIVDVPLTGWEQIRCDLVQGTASGFNVRLVWGNNVGGVGQVNGNLTNTDAGSPTVPVIL